MIAFGIEPVRFSFENLRDGWRINAVTFRRGVRYAETYVIRFEPTADWRPARRAVSSFKWRVRRELRRRRDRLDGRI